MSVPPPIRETAFTGTSIGHGIAAQVANCDIRRHPYPHFVAPNILPRNELADIRAHWPAEHNFAPYGDGPNRSLGEAGRFGLYIVGSAAAERCASLDPVRRDFWRAFVAGSLKSMIVAAYCRYLPGLRARFGEALPELELETYGALVICYKRMKIKVHTDHPANLFNCLMYLNGGGCEESSGTTLYEPRQVGFTHDGLAQLEFDGFNPVGTIPFRDNQLFSFMRTGNSFHGVQPQQITTPTQRVTMNIVTRLTERCVAELYGKRVPSAFRDGQSGRCPEVMAALNAWENAHWDTTAPATEDELVPIINSFRYGQERL